MLDGGLFMSPVIHYWLGDQGVSAPPPEMTYIVSGGALNYSLTHF